MRGFLNEYGVVVARGKEKLFAAMPDLLKYLSKPGCGIRRSIDEIVIKSELQSRRYAYTYTFQALRSSLHLSKRFVAIWIDHFP
jgi:hypothetical protein